MAGSRPTFLKRQKERARQEKQRAKAQRKMQRKLEKETPPEAVESNPAGIPEEEQSS